MLHQRCQCGAKYSFADSAVGKRAKCGKCGRVFILEPEDQGTIPFADEPAPTNESADDDATGVGRHDGWGVGTRPPPPPTPHSSEVSPALVDAPGSSRGYASNVLWTFLFPSSPGNLVTFVLIWLALALLPLLCCFRVPIVSMLLAILLGLWYAAFRFAVLESAAAGESELPNVGFSGDFVAEYLHPLAKWVASWIIVMLPAGVYLMSTVWGVSNKASRLLDLALGGVSGVVQLSDDAVPVITLVCLGLFLWPIVVLCIALGGIETVFRPDLMIRTIIKTFPVYVLTFLMLVGAVGLRVAFGAAVQGAVDSGSSSSACSGGGCFAVTQLLSVGGALYCDIVAMRLIGLYYHHFKDRFAWSWG